MVTADTRRWIVSAALLRLASADPLAVGLIDPDIQPFFEVECINPLDPTFAFNTSSGYVEISAKEATTSTGLVDADGTPLTTPIWGYGQNDNIGHTWPGRTIQAQSYKELHVKWSNELGRGYLLTGLNGQSIVDTSIHWAYSLPGYEGYSIEQHGTPIVVHLHGGNTAYEWDGNPEYFFSPGYAITGPGWVGKVYTYANSQQAASIWYHDHTLGITAPNVYTGMAGFYFLRDDIDTGGRDNQFKLPSFPYEAAFVVQDRMFKDNGELFYPSFKGEPYYEDYITNEDANFPDDVPSKLAEFFGDVMTVNGKIWPKFKVEPRKYRLRLLNGCDSRYLILQFYAVPAGTAELPADPIPLDFFLIGGDDGLATEARTLQTLLFEPSSRFDLVFDFADFQGDRIIMANLAGDEPFGGEATPFLYNGTDRVMAFDVDLVLDTSVPDDCDTSVIGVVHDYGTTVRVRKLGLFEGRDQYNRLQPLLGTAEPATDRNGNPIFWPDTEAYRSVGLAGKQMEGTMAWHSPTTENPNLDESEEWEIWNLSADAHPIHIHLVDFAVMERWYITLDSNAVENAIPEGESPAGDGTYLEPQPLIQHDGSVGQGYRIVKPTLGAIVPPDEVIGANENFPRDVVAALPGQVTRIKISFNKPGEFVWHCHVLSHEDHEMMRRFHVGPMPPHSEGGHGESHLPEDDHSHQPVATDDDDDDNHPIVTDDDAEYYDDRPNDDEDDHTTNDDDIEDEYYSDDDCSHHNSKSKSKTKSKSKSKSKGKSKGKGKGGSKASKGKGGNRVTFDQYLDGSGHYRTIFYFNDDGGDSRRRLSQLNLRGHNV